MSDKLKELTSRLYEQGLSKGKEEGEQILAAAKKEAEGIISKAKAEAEETVRKAEKEADDIRKKAESDVRMASEQSLQATKKDIENLFVDKISSDKISIILQDTAFLKEIIRSVAVKFDTEEAMDLSLIVPENVSGELEPWVAAELSKAVKSDVKLNFSKKIAGGFTIGPSDGSYFISLTDETFKELIGEYLRPVTRKILFGE